MLIYDHKYERETTQFLVNKLNILLREYNAHIGAEYMGDDAYVTYFENGNEIRFRYEN